MRCLALVHCDWGMSPLPTYSERHVPLKERPVWKIRRMGRVDFCYTAATSNLLSLADGYVRPLSFGLAFLRRLSL